MIMLIITMTIPSEPNATNSGENDMPIQEDSNSVLSTASLLKANTIPMIVGDTDSNTNRTPMSLMYCFEFIEVA